MTHDVEVEKTVAEFHEWFLLNQERIEAEYVRLQTVEPAELMTNQLIALFDEIGEQLSVINPDLTCEITSRSASKPYALHISPNGAFELVDLVQQIVSQALPSNKFEFLPFRALWESTASAFAIQFSEDNQVYINPEDVLFTLFPGPLRVDVIVHFEGLPQEEIAHYSEAAMYLLEGILGEFVVMEGVGQVHVGTMESISESTVSIDGLKDSFLQAREDTLVSIKNLLAVNLNERFKQVREQFLDVLTPHLSANLKTWDVTLELWSGTEPTEAYIIFNGYLKDLVVESRQELSLLGEGYYTYMVGTAEGKDVVTDTMELLRIALQEKFLPVGLGVDKTPNGEDARLQAGHYLMLGEGAIAARFYRIATRLGAEGEESGQLQLLAAIAHQIAGEVQEAQTLFEEALELANSDSLKMDIHQNYGSLLHAMDLHEAGLEQMMAALNYDQSSGTKLFNVASSLCILGKIPQALPYLEKAVVTEEGPEILEQIISDEDFALLRKTPEFQSLLELAMD
jgi:tetratricopeptide (TPR) repeat protein